MQRVWQQEGPGSNLGNSDILETLSASYQVSDSKSSPRWGSHGEQRQILLWYSVVVRGSPGYLGCRAPVCWDLICKTRLGTMLAHSRLSVILLNLTVSQAGPHG